MTATAPNVVDPCTDATWAELAGRAGSLFESPAWLRSVRDAFGVTPVARMIGDTALAVGKVDDEAGARRVTFPFSDYCNPIGVDHADQWRRLADSMLDDDVPYRIRLRRHPVVQADPRLTEGGRFAWHGVDLAPDPDDTWTGLTSAARQNVRRARRDGVVVTVDDTRAALARFERLHVRLRRHKYRMLAQPPQYFDALHHHFGGQLAVLEASVDDTIVAAVVLLRHHDTAYYKFNASDPTSPQSRANDLLMWHAIAHASGVWGCQLLDLGLSDLDQPGLLRYKAKYATRSDDIVALANAATGDRARADAVRSLANGVVALVTDDNAADRAAVDASQVLYRLFC